VHSSVFCLLSLSLSFSFERMRRASTREKEKERERERESSPSSAVTSHRRRRESAPTGDDTRALLAREQLRVIVAPLFTCPLLCVLGAHLTACRRHVNVSATNRSAVGAAFQESFTVRPRRARVYAAKRHREFRFRQSCARGTAACFSAAEIAAEMNRVYNIRS